MKLFRTFALLAAFLISIVHAPAQTAGTGRVGFVPSVLSTGSATNFVLPGSANATASIINGGFPANRIVGFSFTAASTTTNLGNAAIALICSSDGIDWQSNTITATITVPLTANSATNAVTVTTNIDTGAFQYWTVLWMTNSSLAGSLTNTHLSFTTKPGF